MLTWENKFDWLTFLSIVVAAAATIVIFISIILAFKFARLAGVNIGIITAIWGFVPFLVAFLERVLYKVGIRVY